MDLVEVGRFTILGILVLLAAVGVPLIMGYYILHPVDVLMRNSPRHLQFTLADFICLLIQWQIALGFSLSQVPNWTSQYFAVIFGFFAVSVLLVWLGGVYSLSRLGVDSARRRIIFLLALPGIVIAMMLAAAAFGSLPAYSLRLFRKEWVFELPVQLDSAGQVALIVIGAAIVSFLACRLLRRTMDWVVDECAAQGSVSRITA